jgi:hypothetical protein
MWSPGGGYIDKKAGDWELRRKWQLGLFRFPSLVTAFQPPTHRPGVLNGSSIGPSGTIN